MKTITYYRNRRIMNHNITLKEAFNRQFVALTTQIPLERGLFEGGRNASVGSSRPSISFKSFEAAYPVSRGVSLIPLEIR